VNAAAVFPFVAAGAFGAVIGSFLNVCVHRIPRGVSIVSPPSACPACGARIARYDNVPVLGWLWLGGRCRACRAPISPRYPVVEALTAALFVLLTARYGVTWELLPALWFAGAMLVVTLIDYDARIIPDAITLPGIALGIAASFLTPVGLLDAVLGAAVGFGSLYAVGWAYHRATGVEGMGGGDIKFAAMLGAFLGVAGLLLTVLLASLLGSLTGLSMMLLRRGGRRTALPFGTFLAPAGLAVYVWGDLVIRWYLDRVVGALR
jgi:leader peptidase (prepilin peptidase)/N-methyltransferase